ncbi:uncharacterized protein FOMMEDRAFT_90969 [Fomitiporia mediterranea MF3/22]|uniref:uncharacterized protein n=1 Tax=Fomitiporia mediterranea (strain MF3/22) TaxID=694068 RepID=UPI0004408085|nr:uncharacterized protein FOMMEDRAFT_90969 [Fomitiporia mediterranea MF3/22]EJD00488.1 hypothetical protein FOMMEDRAFT_90969 [Fomitiporia mediterranea MF3/22]
MSRPALRALLVDLSGTLHIGNNAILSAAEALRRVREAGITVRFCSNSSKESTASLKAKLIEMGFDVKEGELWTSLGALKDVVKLKRLQRPFFLLSESAMEEFQEYTGTSTDGHYTEFDSVVVGLSPDHFNYNTLTKAFRILASSNNNTQDRPPLITTHRAKYIRTPDGELSLGPGPFVTALEDAVGTDLRAAAVGKPSRAFFERVIASIPAGHLTNGKSPEDKHEDIAIIGDDIEADLGGAAVEMGLWRILVKTGKYRTRDENREGQHAPNEVQDSFASFVDDLMRELHRKV